MGETRGEENGRDNRGGEGVENGGGGGGGRMVVVVVAAERWWWWSSPPFFWVFLVVERQKGGKGRAQGIRESLRVFLVILHQKANSNTL